MAGQQGLRIVSFNVNGLRAILKRKGCTLKQLLDDLGADIVCFQETKLKAVERDLAIVEGWDSFFACCQSATARSGVATFVRSGTALPFAAEEGFTGCAGPTNPAAATSGGPAAAAGAHPALAERFSAEELEELDSEGRVVITDHGAFVLFNIYGPAITSEDDEVAAQRFAFKLRFYEALELRWRDLLARGRAVVATGDLNIAPGPLDYPNCSSPQHDWERPDRRWLRSLLESSSSGDPGSSSSSGGSKNGSNAAGLFVDAFRAFHPARRGAFTCWSTATEARVNNWGTRIDLFLVSGLPFRQPPGVPEPHATPAAGAAGQKEAAAAAAAAEEEEEEEEQGSPQQPPAEGIGSRLTSVNASASASAISYGLGVCVTGSDVWQAFDGSDHCPVTLELACTGGCFPCAAAAPSTAMRHVFQGKQLKLRAFFQQKQPGDSADNCRTAPPAGPASPAAQAVAVAAATAAAEPPGGPCGAHPVPSGSSSQPSASQQQQSQQQSQQSQQQQQQQQQQRKASNAAAVGGAKRQQASLISFFQKKRLTVATSMQQGQQAAAAVAQTQAAAASFSLPGSQGPQAWEQEQEREQGQEQEQKQEQGVAPSSDTAATPPLPPPAAPAQAPGPHGSLFLQAELDAAASSRQASQAEAKGAWQGIFQKMKPPKCAHGEEAVAKRVGKSGPNYGRWFYTCGRPAGPKPHGKCDFFKWIERREWDHPFTTLNPSGGSGGGSSSSSAPSKRPKVGSK